MRVVIDGLSVLPAGESGGGETYIQSMIGQLRETPHSNRYLVVVTRDTRGMFGDADEKFQFHVASLDNRSRAARVAYEQLWLPQLAASWNADLVWYPANMIAVLAGLYRVPTIVTIHDAAPWFYERYFPRAFSRSRVTVLKHLATHAAKRSTRVLTVSDFSKREIVRLTGISPEKVSVLYPAVTPLREPAHETNGDVPKPYILLVGRITKHKNFSGFVQAFAVAKEYANLPHHLVIAGTAGPDYDALTGAIRTLGLHERVHIVGQITRRALDGLYASADFLVMPSLYEGFGFPALEAMQHATPMLLSEYGALPEIAGDAAVYFDPTNVQQTADQIVALATSVPLRSQLAEKGKRRFAEFANMPVGRQLVVELDRAASCHASAVAVAEQKAR